MLVALTSSADQTGPFLTEPSGSRLEATAGEAPRQRERSLRRSPVNLPLEVDSTLRVTMFSLTTAAAAAAAPLYSIVTDNSQDWFYWDRNKHTPLLLMGWWSTFVSEYIFTLLLRCYPTAPVSLKVKKNNCLGQICVCFRAF